MTPKRGYPKFAGYALYRWNLSFNFLLFQILLPVLILDARFLAHEYKIFLCYLVERQCDKFFSYPLKICGHTMKPFRYYFDQLKSPSKDREKQKFTYISVQASLSLIILLYISCKSIEFNPL